MLRGVGEIFATTDVYGIANLDQKAATILLRGAVTESLDPTSKNIEGPKNNPMMPLAWLREYTAPNGTDQGQGLLHHARCRTDFADEDLRRLVVNAAFHLTGLKVPEKPMSAFVDPFQPTNYSAINKKDFYKERNLKPDDYVLGKSPATGLPAEANQNPPPGQGKESMIPSGMPRTREPADATTARPRPSLRRPPASASSSSAMASPSGIVYYSRMETELHLRYPDKQLVRPQHGPPRRHARLPPASRRAPRSGPSPARRNSIRKTPATMAKASSPRRINGSPI